MYFSGVLQWPGVKAYGYVGCNLTGPGTGSSVPGHESISVESLCLVRPVAHQLALLKLSLSGRAAAQTSFISNVAGVFHPLLSEYWISLGEALWSHWEGPRVESSFTFSQVMIMIIKLSFI